MKALSLWQPWASLVMIGAKKIETRSWPTSHRGPLVIHAASKVTHAQIELRHEEPFRTLLHAEGIERWQDLPLGCALGTVELVDCREMRWGPAFPPLPCGPCNGDGSRAVKGGGVTCQACAGTGVVPYMYEPPLEPERSFGLYTPGRFAWYLDDVRPFGAPVQVKARQRLFNLPLEELGFR